MTTPQPELPNDLARCHALIKQLHGEVRQAEMRVSHLDALVAEQKQTIDTHEETIETLSADNELMKRALFGSRRERYTDDESQLLLFGLALSEQPAPEEDSQDESSEPKKKRTSKGRQRRIFPEFLPREEEKHELTDDEIPEAMRNNPNARRFFKLVRNRLEMTPMQLKVIEEYQEVIVLDQEDETSQVVTAKRPPSLLQSYAGNSLLAYLTVSRFADHLPYYRQEDILGRSGFRIDRSTQWRWMRSLAQGVTPLVDLMWDRIRQSQVLGMDETPVMELGGKGQTHKGYLWCGVGDVDHPYDCFFYSSNRRSQHPEDYLVGFEGYLTTDAYVAYERIGNLSSQIINTSCWVHARRKFEACHHLGATHQTHMALAYMRQLFDLEDVFRPLNADQRLTERQERSQPLVEAFYNWLQEERVRQLPKSKLRGAIDYMLNRWETFTRFLESGAVPMDNNAAERALKYPILGRKAWLFVGNQEAGETAAKLFTLTKSCNRLHIDPFAYLQDVYARLPTMGQDELPLLLPDRWLADHPQHLIPERVQEAIERAQRAREQRAERRALRDAA